MSGLLEPLNRFINQTSLVKQIVIGLVLGVAVALFVPGAAPSVALFGDLFIGALKAVAPVLVLILVAAAIAGHEHGQPTHVRAILVLYLIGTFASALVAVIASFAFPTTLVLNVPPVEATAPVGIVSVLKNLLLSAATNPVRALLEANYIGVLAWAVALGLALRHAAPATRGCCSIWPKPFRRSSRW